MTVPFQEFMISCIALWRELVNPGDSVAEEKELGNSQVHDKRFK